SVSRAVAVCAVCNSVVDGEDTRRLFKEGKASQRMVAVVTHQPETTGKRYRLATEKDVELYNEAERCLQEKRERLKNEWGMDPVPDEPMNQEDPNTVASIEKIVKRKILPGTKGDPFVYLTIGLAFQAVFVW
ncbi:MAG: hypothetical protein AABZ61_01790, partial [Bacteroidota bacterium]